MVDINTIPTPIITGLIGIFTGVSGSLIFLITERKALKQEIKGLNRRIDDLVLPNSQDIQTKYKDFNSFIEKYDLKKLRNIVTEIEGHLENGSITRNISNYSPTIATFQQSEKTIKIGRYALKKEVQSKKRNNLERDINFNFEFESFPQVFVAIEKINSPRNDLGKNVLQKLRLLYSRYSTLEVYIKDDSVKKDKFTLVVNDWNQYIVSNIDLVWIAIGE